MLKPDDHSVIKIADFGLAIICHLKSYPIDGGFVGTPTYMAPEILEKLDYNEQVDMWSYGMILWT
jgi:serine/threonine protein kinase